MGSEAMTTPEPQSLREAAEEWMRRGEALRLRDGLYEREAFAEAEESLRAALSLPSQPEAVCAVCGGRRDAGVHETFLECEATHGPCLDPGRHHPFGEAATGEAEGLRALEDVRQRIAKAHHGQHAYWWLEGAKNGIAAVEPPVECVALRDVEAALAAQHHGSDPE